MNRYALCASVRTNESKTGIILEQDEPPVTLQVVDTTLSPQRRRHAVGIGFELALELAIVDSIPQILQVRKRVDRMVDLLLDAIALREQRDQLVRSVNSTQCNEANLEHDVVLALKQIALFGIWNARRTKIDVLIAATCELQTHKRMQMRTYSVR
jgi:hypothetical protein